MHQRKRAATYLPLIVIFIITNSLCIVFRERLAVKNINTEVVLAANLILFLITIITTAMHSKALLDTNPNVFIRSVMGATIIKFFVIAGAVFIYLFLARANRSIPAILISMGLYVAYTIFELKSIFRLNRRTNAD